MIVWTVIAATPALLALAEIAPWSWLASFIGRFHPVILHFPIAFLLLTALFEVLQLLTRNRWQFPVQLVLFLSAGSAVAAASLGWLLMRADVVEGPLMERHFQGGVAVALLGWMTLALRLRLGPVAAGWGGAGYRGLLALTCAVLLRAAHDGASLTHGEGYLREYAPWTKTVRRAPAFPTTTPVRQWDLYQHVAAAIIQTRCLECHGDGTVKGGLNLATWAAIQKGGKTGAALVPGRPEQSLLFQRMNLPLDHQDHMPPRRKAQPSPEENALLRKWIALGAPAQGTLADVHLDNRLLSVVGRLPELLQGESAPADAGPEEIDPAVVAKLRSTLAPAVSRLQQRYPYLLRYVARDSAELELSAKLLDRRFGDDDLAAFASVAPKLVWIDLSGTAITDRSASTLRLMKNLRVLRLSFTDITDGFLKALGPMEQMESLALYGTTLTEASLTNLQGLPKIQKIYIGQTAIPPNAPAVAALAGRLVFEPVAPPAIATGANAPAK